MTEKEKLNIAILGHKRFPINEGGIEKGVKEHAIRMAALGHNVTVYNRGSDNINGKDYNQEKLTEYKGVKIVTIPAPKGAAEVPVYSFLATMHAVFHNYDVISYRASGPCAMIPLAKFFGKRCIASLHGIDSQRAKWGGFAKKYLAFGERIAAKMSDECLVLSENMKEYIRDNYGKETLLFTNGVERPELADVSVIADKFGLEKDGYILSLGRIEPEKGIHYLIEAFKNVDTDKKLVIAGGDSNHSYYKKIQKMAKSDSRIILAGEVHGEIKQELYSNAYMFVLPSDLEGMANTLLEAMSYGNCCLISDIPENSEAAKDHAVYFKHSDTDDLQKKIQKLTDDKNLVNKTKEGTADFVVENYNWDIVVEQLLRVYKGEKVNYQDVYLEHKGKECKKLQ